MTYWLLLLPTAIVGYVVGSLNSLVLASNFVFHSNLQKLGTGNLFLSNFKRIYKIGGALKLLAVELVRDIIPVLLGGLLLGLKGHADVGHVFAGFCLILGSLFPVFYGFRGGHAIPAVIVTALFTDVSLGIVGIIITAALLLATKYVSLSAVAGALIITGATVLIVDNSLVITLFALIAAIVLIKHIPAVNRILRGEETKISFREDLSYKFDEQF